MGSLSLVFLGSFTHLLLHSSKPSPRWLQAVVGRHSPCHSSGDSSGHRWLSPCRRGRSAPSLPAWLHTWGLSLSPDQQLPHPELGNGKEVRGQAATLGDLSDSLFFLPLQISCVTVDESFSVSAVPHLQKRTFPISQE